MLEAKIAILEAEQRVDAQVKTIEQALMAADDLDHLELEELAM